MTELLSAAAQRGHAEDLIRRASALIFDVDGTLAETEELHRQAFNEAFLQTGLGWWWDRTVYQKLLRVTGGKDRIRAFDATRPDPALLSDSEVAELHRIKTARYAELIAKGSCCLRPGVAELLSAARRRGQRLAIATTTSAGNIDALLSSALGAAWRAYFDVIVAGDEVPHKKPAPDVYVEALARLGLSADECLAIEDSANGLISASRAGIAVVITRSIYFRDDDFVGALLVVDDLSGLAVTFV